MLSRLDNGATTASGSIPFVLVQLGSAPWYSSAPLRPLCALAPRTGLSRRLAGGLPPKVVRLNDCGSGPLPPGTYILNATRCLRLRGQHEKCQAIMCFVS